MSDCKFETKTFNDALSQNELIGSKCRNCTYVAVPQRYICPVCHSENMERLVLSGEATLATYTVIYIPPTEMANAGYDAKHPYCTGIVTLAEGPRVSAQIVGLDLSKPQDIKIGTPLKMIMIDRGPEGSTKKVLAFEPA
ncbi:MAG: Zn-ribbon domain-containing OB-fold protein [Anaerolineaceae bacterium]